MGNEHHILGSFTPLFFKANNFFRDTIFKKMAPLGFETMFSNYVFVFAIMIVIEFHAVLILDEN
jgi:hypothetical protein